LFNNNRHLFLNSALENVENIGARLCFKWLLPSVLRVTPRLFVCHVTGFVHGAVNTVTYQSQTSKTDTRVDRC